MQLKELIHEIETTYPTSLAESWDNVGLMVGDLDQEIKTVYTVIEITDAVIEDAINHKVDLIITHHPFLFSKLNQITTASIKGKQIHNLIKHNISVYSMHTNFDIAFGGMNDYFAHYLGFTITKHFEFEQADPSYLEKYHAKEIGLGRICTLEQEMSLFDLCEHVKKTCSLKYLRFVGDPHAIIRNVAIITGSGSDYFPSAQAAGADVLISGDLKYHDAQDVLAANMNLIDCGHYETEHLFNHAIADFLETKYDYLTVIRSNLNLNPFQSI